MSRRIVISPVTRISGFMEIEVTVEQGQVVAAETRGAHFRGFEQMMVGRSPYDAIFLTQRICGICSAAHSVAASLALEDAMGVEVTDQGHYLRDIIHGAEFLQNHIRHFYQFTLPDFVRLPPVSSMLVPDHGDFRLPGELNDRLSEHYFESLSISRLAHQLLSVLGGKAPHNHGVFVGGVTRPPTADQVAAMRSMVRQIEEFIRTRAVPDVFVIARYYDEYFHLGRGPGNLLTFGAFTGYRQLGTLYVEPQAYVSGTTRPFDPGLITEEVDHAFYEGAGAHRPFEAMPAPDRQKPGAYSWVKAPRYDGLPCEVGPLARLWLSGEYRRGISAMDRTIARVLEAEKVAGILGVLLDHVDPDAILQKEWELPPRARGAGIVDTTRGALGHWLKIEEGRISFYQVITPSAWDFSTRGAIRPGTAEQALIGTPIRDPEHPVEIGRIIRSFDPCMSCATHVYRPGQPVIRYQVMP